MDLNPGDAGRVGDNVFIACLGSSAHLGLWGSLVYPSGFGSLRRQFKSAQPHSTPPAEKSEAAVGTPWHGNSRRQRGGGIGRWPRGGSTRTGRSCRTTLVPRHLPG